MIKAIFTGIVIYGLFVLNAHALSVGEMSVNSRLGDLLDSRLMLENVSQREMSTLKVSLATRELFSQAEIPYPTETKIFKFSVALSGNNQATIHITSSTTISDPFVQLLLNIQWENGHIVHEYAALIDPPQNVDSSPLAQGVQPSEALKSANIIQAKLQLQRVVKKGDTLGAIAEQYLPERISYQQAWMAFYHLNPDAFENNNLNNLIKGATIRIPDHAQMAAMPKAKAVREVRKLSKPLVKSARSLPKQSPVLVIGNSASPVILPTTKEGQQDESLQGFNQMAPITINLAEFEESIKQEMLVSRELNQSIKAELIAVRGENRELTGRMRRIEQQLGNISQFLTIQASEGLPAIGQVQQDELSLTQTTPFNKAHIDLSKSAELNANQIDSVQMPESGSSSSDEPNNNTLSSPIKSFSQSSQSLQGDGVNAVRQEGGDSDAQITREPTAPRISHVQEEAVLENPQPTVVAAEKMLSRKQAPNNMVAGETTLDQAPLLVLGQRSEQQRSYLLLDQEEKIGTGQLIPTPSANTLTSDNQLSQSKRHGNVPVMRMLKEKAATLFSALGAFSNDITADTWKIIAGIGGALLGLLLLLRVRGRKKIKPDTDSSRDEPLSTVETNSVEMKDILPCDLTNTDNDENYQQGSSLFDLSDESFLASEAIEKGSSLFALDEGKETTIPVHGKRNDPAEKFSIGSDFYDNDPLAEAEIYLAYDRNNAAISMLEDALRNSPHQPPVIHKLLSLYQQNNDIEKFKILFDASAQVLKEEGGAPWTDTKLLAAKVIPEHPILSAIQASGQEEDLIPVLNESIAASARLPTQQPQVQSPESSLRTNTGLSLDNELDDLDDDQSTDKGLSLNEQALNQDIEEDLESALKEVNQHDPETALGLAKAYIELGEDEIAKEFLSDVILAGEGTIKQQAQQLLKSMDS